jgi:outer membrane receptor protein involved in Fe transport
MAVLIPSFGSFESSVRVQSLRKQTRRVAEVVVALLGAAVAAGAQTASPGRDLTKVTLEDQMNITITTATRTAEGAARAPARVQVITAEQVQRRGYRSLVDVLKDLPDFKVDLGGDPDYPAEITVQGSRGSDRIVLLLDGIRVSSPTNEPLPIMANYPVHAVRQIEILYGPASALYGADAFSAVINIISKDAAEGQGLSVSTSVGQFGLYNQAGSYTAKIGKSGTFLVAAQAQYDGQPDLSKYYPDDFRGRQGQRTGTFATIFGPMTSPKPVSAGFSIPFTAHSTQALVRAGGWQVMFFQSHVRASTTPPDTPDNAVYNADAFNRNTLMVGAASYTRPIGRATSTSTLTLSRHELDPRSGYWNVFSNMDRSYKYAFGSMAKIELGADTLIGAPQNPRRVTVGFDFRLKQG